jgi:Domain of unknown function (DUF1918)
VGAAFAVDDLDLFVRTARPRNHHQEAEMPVNVGDRITVSAANVNAPERTGTIATVVRQEPVRVEVRWDDGHTTVIAPADGAASIVSSNTTRNQPKSRPTKTKPPR